MTRTTLERLKCSAGGTKKLSENRLPAIRLHSLEWACPWDRGSALVGVCYPLHELPAPLTALVPEAPAPMLQPAGAWGRWAETWKA